MIARERPILVVEDSDEDFVAFRRALKQCGETSQIVRYLDGESCLAALREQLDGVPAIVVLDLNLPAMAGADVLREIRGDEKLRKTPVVILSTSTDPRDIRRCYDLGIGGYIVKQGDFSEFCDKVKNLTNYWLRSVHLP